MPRTDLPRISLGLTFSEDQLARMEQMIERYNATRNPPSLPPMHDYAQCVASGLVALELILMDCPPDHRSVFEVKP